MKIKLLTSVLAAVLIITSSSCFFKKSAELNPKKIELPAEGETIINGINSFGIKLLKSVENKNTMISPFSMTSVLSMIYDGAAGNTREQMANLLAISTTTSPDATYKALMEQLPEVDEKNVTISTANALWINSDFTVKQDFIDQCKDYFHASVFVKPFDAETVDEINNFVKDRTNGKIDKIIDNLQGEFALLNAIYFYGEWFDQFSSTNTTQEPFYLDSINTVDVPTMHDEIAKAGRYINDTVDLCELYYGQGNYSMVIVLPAEGMSIDSLLDILTVEKWNSWCSNIYLASDVSVSLPKFSFEKEYDLTNTIRNMGVEEAFSDSADFSLISNSRLMISQIKQKTFIEVNEKGTEAAAATFVGMETAAMPDFFEANRPFIFAIRETTTGLILFMGIVRNPVE